MSAPGWYSDPGQPGMQRYWDGQAWTSHTAVGSPSPPPGSGGKSAGFIIAIVAAVVMIPVVLIILAAVVIFAVGNTTDDAQSRACRIEQRTLVTAAEAYRESSPDGQYPAVAGLLISEGFITDPPVGFSYLANRDLTAFTLTPIGDCADVEGLGYP